MSPDSKTVWSFKEQLTELEIVESIFNLFLSHLDGLGLIVREGKIVDASFVEAPIQRNTEEENKAIKAGEIPDTFSQNPHKQAQKDTDARWTKKGSRFYFGYKDHVKVGVQSKFILKYVVTEASVHDSQLLDNLLDETDNEKVFYADSC